jgi:hypothetical protein
MSSGFNTDVHVGDQSFHVQTEDRGPSHPVIDTVIYQQGRILYRRKSSYEHLNLSVEISDEALRERVAEQHRRVIDELRSGALAAEIAAAGPAAHAPPGGAAPSHPIQIQLLNPKGWLSGGKVLLDIEIVGRADHQPQPEAQVEAAIEGALRDGHHAAVTDAQGRAKIEFPLPPLGKGDLALIIRAKKDSAKDEIRFTMRSRHTAPANPA